jgi:hypothetical protein
MTDQYEISQRGLDAGLSHGEFFEKLRKDHAKALNVLPSRAMNNGRLHVEPLFLYHAGRTGGVAFSTAVQAGISLMLTLNNIDNQPRCGRVEGDDLSPDLVQAHHLFIATHAPYGFHEKFPRQSFKLIALLRDPVPRVSSLYTKVCMRADEPASREGFLKFIDETESHNGMVCQLCGLQPGSDVTMDHFEQAREILDEKFTSYTTTEHSGRLANYFLSAFNLPNMLMEILNRTLPQYRVDIDDLADLIRERNAPDVALYDWAVANPRMPVLEYESEVLSPFTIVMYEDEKQTHSSGRGGVFATEIVVTALRDNPELIHDMEQLVKLCKRVADGAAS